MIPYDDEMFHVGDEIVIRRPALRPKWWQLRKLFSYYILRRRILTENLKVVGKETGTTLTLSAPISSDHHNVIYLSDYTEED